MNIKNKKESSTIVKTHHSSSKKIIRIIAVLASILIFVVFILLIIWAIPHNYSSEIAKYNKVTDACQATVESYIDDNGVLNIVKDDDKDFVVMNITDVHLGGTIFTASKDKKALEAIYKLADSIKPDLIICNGDFIFPAPGKGTISTGRSMKTVAEFMDKLEIPWTVSFGNHESEIYGLASRRKLGEILESNKYKFCVFKSGPEDITGVSNQAIIIRNNSDKSVNQVLACIDSNDYTKLMSDYDVIHEDQIEWFKNTISSIADESGTTADKISSMVFTHIPMKEFDIAWENGNNILFGEKNEPVCCPAVVNRDKDVFVDEMLEFGSVKAIFAGHDHINNYCADYNGILLTYSLSIDYNAYKDIDKTDEYRGATIISIKNDSSFDISQQHYTDIK